MRRKLLLILLAAVLFVLGFPPFSLWPLAALSLVPWIFVLEESRTRKEAVLYSLLFSFLITLMGFYWVAYVLQNFGGLPWSIAILMLMAFGLGCQPQFAMLALIGPRRDEARLPLSPLVRAVSFASLYTALDFLSPKLFRDSLGHSLHAFVALKQIAELTGVWGLTFLLVLFAEGCVFALRAWKVGARSIRTATMRPLILAILLGALGTAYGLFRLPQVRADLAAARARGDVVTFALIQANIGDVEKIAAESGLRDAANQVVQSYTLLSSLHSAEPKVDAIVWPETAYPSLFRSPGSPAENHRDAQVEKLARDTGIPLHFGGYDREGGKEFNTLFFLEPSGGLRAYHKNILLPFGEEIPFHTEFPSLSRMFPQVGNFGRGPGPIALDAPLRGGKHVRLAPLICYEVLESGYVREAVRKGARLLLNVTNDSWFGPGSEPDLHLALSTFRSVETRLPLVRATNTGYSALVLPDGEIAQRSSLNEVDPIRVEAPLTTAPRFGVLLWGDAFAWLMTVLAASFLIKCRILGQRRTHQA